MALDQKPFALSQLLCSISDTSSGRLPAASASSLRTPLRSICPSLVVAAVPLRSRNQSRALAGRVQCEAAAAEATTQRTVSPVDIKTYDAAIAEAGDKLVVLDMYTQWCGPCKLIAPKIEALAQRYEDVVFLKLDCNEENKPLAKSLGIKSVPTFKLLRKGQIVAEVVGAKYDAIVEEIMKQNVGEQAPRTRAAAGFLEEGKMVEVTKDTFDQALEQAGDRLVLLDMFTDWCGPCKLIAPKIAELAAANRNVVFLKINCNEYNKPLAKELGIKSVPTFKFFKNREQIDEVRGAKADIIEEKMKALL